MIDNNENFINDISKKFNLSTQVVKILYQRGLTTVEQINKFLHPSIKDINDPFLLNDMDRAVKRIKLALSKKEKKVLCFYRFLCRLLFAK